MREKSNKYLIAALLIGIFFHSSALFFTLENTYDALIHQFFANHYANSWFEPWNYSWYTGFTVLGYPPLVHQVIALLSFIGGLGFGLYSVGIIGIILFITGVYRYSLALTGNRQVAGHAALFTVFSSSFVETLHIFGQLPSIIGISILLHSLPELYLWIKTANKKYLFTSLSLLAITVSSHHVTPIFGMIFFISPLIGTVLMDMAKEKKGDYKSIKLSDLLVVFKESLIRIASFIIGALVLIVVCILPYWINSKKNPITQIPIPHGSRDNFLEVTSSGLMFFLIPWGIILFILPYLFYRFYSKRYIFFGLSFSMLTLLGTGGTTPIPKLLLGDHAFNILTLDRFTLWASIMCLPFCGEFLFRIFEGDLKVSIEEKFGSIYYKIISGLFGMSIIVMAIFTISLGYFRPLQPQKINILPIVNFLNQDQHDQWRYLTLGFGDQMAWLSSQTKALTVDGNYHSARRLPELTSRAVERLENSKFRGIEGIGSLQQFLTIPEKYNLKYIFSNDKFYDPILYFCGWHRLSQLENGIMVWEKLNVPPLSKVLPKEDVPLYQKLMWGIIPILSIIIAFSLNIQMAIYQALKSKNLDKPDFLNLGILYVGFSKKIFRLLGFWAILMAIIYAYIISNTWATNANQITPVHAIRSFYDDLDFKRYEKAHALLDPEKEISLAQFMLETAVSDGIINSYAKLESIKIITLKKGKKNAQILARTKWITPLNSIKKDYYHHLIKRNGLWYIVPKTLDSDLPPDQFISDNLTHFFKHGRRKISTQQSYHDDILKQPELEILSAKLIKINNQYVIIGELQNIDNMPADVVVNANLYDKNYDKIASYNAMQVIKHKIMPKEITSFKINFEEIAWNSAASKKPETFNPDEKFLKNLKTKPITFDIQSAGNVTITDLYHQVAISELDINKTHCKGTLFNFGLQEVTVPELLISYYNQNKELIYVDYLYLNVGLRVQRKQYFDYQFKNLKNIESVLSTTENCYVNGLPNKSISEKIIPNRKWKHHEEQLQPINGDGFSYIKIELNNFVGNPK